MALETMAQQRHAWNESNRDSHFRGISSLTIHRLFCYHKGEEGSPEIHYYMRIFLHLISSFNNNWMEKFIVLNCFESLTVFAVDFCNKFRCSYWTYMHAIIPRISKPNYNIRLYII